LGQQIGGWKCSVPSEARALNIAPIFASTVFRNSPCAIVATGTLARIEPEVAFVMAHDLPKRAEAYTEAEIRNAIAEPRLVLELLGTRYADPDAASWPEMMADFVQNQGLFIGPVVPGGLDRRTRILSRHDSHAGRRALDACGSPWRRTSIATVVLDRQFPGGARRRIARGTGGHYGLVRRRDRGSDRSSADSHIRQPRPDRRRAPARALTAAIGQSVLLHTWARFEFA
jgi:hypothetical protein